MRLETTLATLLTLATLTLFLPTTTADAHGRCDAAGHVALGIVSIAGRAYVDDRNYLQGNGVWTYLETNGAAGLQRGGASAILPSDRDICYDDSTAGPDQLVY